MGRNIWKYSEAYGKFKGCPFWSIDALKLYETSKNKSLAKVANKLRHEHTYPQILLINKLKNSYKMPNEIKDNPIKVFEWTENDKKSKSQDDDDFNIREKVKRAGGLENMKPEDKIT